MTGIPSDIADYHIGQIVTSSWENGDAGSVIIKANGDVRIDGYGSEIWTMGAGNAGNVEISAKSIYISTNVFATSNEGKNGGAIALIATDGNISTNILNTFSLSSGNVENGGNGGAIALIAHGGNVSTTVLNSFSYTNLGNTGHGGAINIQAPDGDIIGNTINSFSVSEYGNASIGGNVTLGAKNNINNLGILTISSDSKSGTVELTGFGDLSVKNTQIITSKQVTITNPWTGVNVNLNTADLGQSGDVKINSLGNITLNNSRIESDTKGRELAGNVTITSPGIVTFNSSYIKSDTVGAGQAGSIKITANQAINLTDAQSYLSAKTSNSGNAGNITLESANLTLEKGASITTSTSGTGKAGDILLKTSILNVAGGAEILAFTSGHGDGGTITVLAPTMVNLGNGVQDFSPVVSVETSGSGKAGNIIINTPDLTISDTARITATATKTATNKDGGGSITLNANKMNLAGIVGIFAETQGAAPAGTLKLNTYNNQNTLDLTLFPGSIISASTSGSGNGGDLEIAAPDTINITGKGKLTVETKGLGNGGNILISTHNLNIKETEISANTTGEGKAGSINFNVDNINIEQDAKISATTSGGIGGSININATKLNLNSGGQLLTTTSGNNAACDINLNVKESINLSDKNTGFFANTTKNSTGNGGNIKIDPIIMIIENGAAIAVNSEGTGIGGNIFLQSENLILNNGLINAETVNSNGGVITLDIGNYLLLANNSKITSTAGTAQSGGNGGNVQINAPFIIGFSTNPNHQIIANAFSGKGGNINITTNGIFGIQYIDIQASSQFGVNGTITINTPGIDPASGLAKLPSAAVDLSGLIQKSCNVYKINSFKVSGKNGVPVGPHQRLTPNQIFSDFGLFYQNIPQKLALISENTLDKEKLNITEAQGLIKDEKGQIMLTLQPVKITANGVYLHPLDCGRLVR